MNGSAPVVEARRAPARYIHGVQAVDPETSRLDERGDRPIEVAPAAKPLPYRIQTVLPAADIRIWRRPMLTEDQFAAWPEDPAHLPKCGGRIRNSAECVRHKYGIDTVVLKRDLIARQANELHLEGERAHGPLRHPGHLRRWIEAPDLAHLRRIIEWEIQARTDTNLENPPTGARHHLLALAHVRLQPTREVDDSWKNVPAIQTHQFLVAFAARVGSLTNERDFPYSERVVARTASECQD